MIDERAELIEAVPVLLWRARPDGYVEYVNRAWLDHCGMTLEEVQGAGWMRALHPDDLGPTRLAWAEAVRAGDRYEVEQRLLRGAGGHGWFLSRAAPSRDAEGRVVAWHGANVDITDRKQAEHLLRQKQLQLEAILDYSPALISIKDPDGLILLANRAFAALDAPPLNEFVGRSVFDVFPEEVAKQLWSNDLAALEAGAPVYAEEVVRHKDGAWHTYLTVKFPIFEQPGLPLGVCAISNDITERKRAEDEREQLQLQLAQAQKLESIGRLAGGVAHDFNNMLGAILGNAELALDQLDPASDLAAFLGEIRKAAEHSAELTRQLLTFARKQPIAPRILDVNRTVDGMLKVVRRLVGESVELEWVPDDRVRPANVDPTQIQQVLTNLCVNARDAGARHITVATGNRRIESAEGGEGAGEYVMLSVCDDGSGLDEATRARMFEPFFTTKELGRGTGLGLSTIHGIVKQNHGQIVVEAELGRGTTFLVYLPAAGESAPVNGSPAGDPVESIAHGTVLFVEDEPALLAIGVRMLQAIGYQVLAAGGPDEALCLAAQHGGSIDLLMTDVVMPGLNGRELAERVRALVPDLACVFMSGYSSNILGDGVLDDSVIFLQKPFVRRELDERVREALLGRATRAASSTRLAPPSPRTG